MSDIQHAVRQIPQEIPTPLILYDGMCRLCTGTVLFVIKRDRRKLFWFASMQSTLGQHLLRRLGLSPDDLKTFVLVEADRHFTKSTAALRVARRLGGSWSAAGLLGAIPRPVRDAVYDWVARNRYRWFGRREQCLIPSSDVRDRFVDPG